MTMLLSSKIAQNVVKTVPLFRSRKSNMHNFVGQRFGRLTVLHRVVGGAWACLCDCGNTSVVVTGNLRKGNSRSCGCLWREKITTHGMMDTPEYLVWKAMRSRCNTKSDLAWRNYGARGIKVCEDWDDFLVFLKDMGNRPSPLHELDRIDNDKGYSKENCRWITHQQNLNNRRNNRYIEFQGIRKTAAEWAREKKMHHRTLLNRIDRGWPVDRALSEGLT